MCSLVFLALLVSTAVAAPQAVANVEAAEQQPAEGVQPAAEARAAVAEEVPAAEPRVIKVTETKQVPIYTIVNSNVENNFDGNFKYGFETDNGIAIQAAGSVREISPKAQAQVIQGSYSYTAPDGTLITTTYTADENGFVVQGDHLSPLIAKSIAYIRSLIPPPGEQKSLEEPKAPEESKEPVIEE